MSDKATAEHSEHVEQNPSHEGVLLGVVALAALFSNCVEAFGLIRASQKWEKEEQLLLTRLGIQQARLLLWGDALGVSSPPKSVTVSAVPRHPSAAYPDLKEPTFFGARNPRLDEPETRMQIEDALNAIVDRSAHMTREEMMEKFGLKPPKRFTSDYQPALDTTRLEGFREKYELLQEVAESYAQINTRRSNSIVMQSWVISDKAKFANFIQLTQEKIDFLVDLMDVKPAIDRGVRMDIRGFGWHLTADRTRIAQDVSKLRLIAEACQNDYPEYLIATQQALEQITRENRENSMTINPFSTSTAMHPPKSASVTTYETGTNGSSEKGAAQNGSTPPPTPGKDKTKRPGMFGGLFKSFRHKSKDSTNFKTARSQSTAQPSPSADRSLSDAGPITSSAAQPDSSFASLEPVRSKSVGDIYAPASLDKVATLDKVAEVANPDDEIARNKLKQVETYETIDPIDSPLEHTDMVKNMISRHDQYHGIARVETKDLRQGNM